MLGDLKFLKGVASATGFPVPGVNNQSELSWRPAGPPTVNSEVQRCCLGAAGSREVSGNTVQ